ncbi:alpha/beta hydrolase [Alicyclobacillus sp. ALC3]|uniref:alpha/beta hydrolase n=1 Tax=Alicyclobacillus sp. ALC3 TaxID=2796143 RepID=UPI002379FCF4|nr:alpha/beta fold hydrolase [Alicyclobacillus sp. ALC3]WDL95932.1 alpha/beta fold hydrolase [Alicyclobacillus sp. ALC3]
MAHRLTHPARRSVDVAPSDHGLQWENVTFFSYTDDIPLQGWYIPCQGANSTVIMAHGYRMNRTERSGFALQYAKDLVASGHNVVMFDFRNSGESQGAVSTVGHYEQRDLHGVIAWVKDRHRGPVFLHGFSMGAATCLLTAAKEPVSAIIADSPFDNLNTYLVENLPRWSKFPSFPFTWLVLQLIPFLVKASPEQVVPLHALPALADTPILFIHGMGDKRIPWQHSQRMYERSSNSELWLVPDADHCGSYVADPDAYTGRVTKFLNRTLQLSPKGNANSLAPIAEGEHAL